MFIPDPDLDFLPIPDPGVKKSQRLPDPEFATPLVTQSLYKAAAGGDEQPDGGERGE